MSQTTFAESAKYLHVLDILLFSEKIIVCVYVYREYVVKQNKSRMVT